MISGDNFIPVFVFFLREKLWSHRARLLRWLARLIPDKTEDYPAALLVSKGVQDAFCVCVGKKDVRPGDNAYF